MILFDSRSLDTEALFRGHMRTARLSVCLEFSSLVGGWCHLLKIESGWRAFKDQQHPECRSPVFHQKTDHVISCNSGTAAGLVLANELNDRLRVSQVGGNKPELNAVNVILTLILWSWTWCCSDCKAVWFYVRTLEQCVKCYLIKTVVVTGYWRTNSTSFVDPRHFSKQDNHLISYNSADQENHQLHSDWVWQNVCT